MSTEREACSRLIEQWEARARKAFPTDAMLINRHIRELHEALAQPVAAEPAQDPDPFDDRKDAERYRWLRSRLPGAAYRIAGVIYSEGGAGVDAAIDAARAPTPA